jgi:aminoglycoside 3-N-acetyltransferase
MGGDPEQGRCRRGGNSRAQLAADLRALGVKQAQNLLIHCSLRAVSPADGPATLLGALQDVAGPGATLVVPTQTTLNSLTSRAFLAATAGLDEPERAHFLADMPGFDPARTPSAGMGAFAEYLRTQPTAHRSAHPQTSFAALGPDAGTCTLVHDLDCHLGERSPLGWLYASNAAILLLGVGYPACTAFHLAEYLLPGARPMKTYRCFTAGTGGRTERVFTDIDLDDSDFGSLGVAAEAAALGIRRGRVGAGDSRWLPLPAVTDFASAWFQRHRERVPA